MEMKLVTRTADWTRLCCKRSNCLEGLILQAHIRDTKNEIRSWIQQIRLSYYDNTTTDCELYNMLL